MTSDDNNNERINLPQFSVSEISNAIKNVMEGAFSYVRVRGELSRITVAKSGHLYTDLKDENAVINAICWKGSVAKLSIRPEEGMDVICTGRVTTYPGRSNYQLIIETMELAGEGALLKLLEERKKKLAAEGLFDESRKKPIPVLPETIGVITSPTGAVIRDIMHRLEDRFPRRVLLWPVMVQGEGTVKQVVEGLQGFNAMAADGDLPRPDVLIVARGGGSLEDLMPFNDEAIVRAVAASTIPVISAIGHETDTTLIDYAADKRVPTPTGAAEVAVPVRSEMVMRVDNAHSRLNTVMLRRLEHHKTHIDGLARGLGDPKRLLENVAQRFDFVSDKLDGVLVRMVDNARGKLDRLGAQISHPKQKIAMAAERLETRVERLNPAFQRIVKQRADRLDSVAALLKSYSYHGVLERGFALIKGADGMPVTRAAQTKAGQNIDIVFADGTQHATIDGDKKPADKQGDLF